MDRRQCIAGLAALLAATLKAEAQQSKRVHRVAYLAPQCGVDPLAVAFDSTMKRLGHIEGQNLIVERRFLCQDLDRVDAAVEEVVRLKVDVIVTAGIRPTAAAKRATTTIPIVFIAVRAPVERGLVVSLARPGANITGIANFPVLTIDSKLFQLAKEINPRLSRLAVLRSADDPPGAVEAQENAAHSLGLRLSPIPFSNATDLENLSGAIDRSNVQMLVVPDTSLAYTRRKEIVQLVAKKSLPTAYSHRESVQDGGLIAAGPDFQEFHRQTAEYVDRFLRGTKPGDLPIVQATKLHIAINLKTAKALGLTISPSLLLQANEVIE